MKISDRFSPVQFWTGGEKIAYEKSNVLFSPVTFVSGTKCPVIVRSLFDTISVNESNIINSLVL